MSDDTTNPFAGGTITRFARFVLWITVPLVVSDHLWSTVVMGGWWDVFRLRWRYAMQGIRNDLRVMRQLRALPLPSKPDNGGTQ
jgi:hypothetical protein